MMKESTPLRLLLVEDSEDDAILLLNALEEAGYAVDHTRVESAEALISALPSAAWQTVISDYRLPGFDGLRALEIVRRYTSDLPFIFVSGTVQDRIGVKAMQGGANDYILKDNLTRLGPVIRRELKQAERRREMLATKVQYRAILDSVQDAIIVTTRSGLIHVFNKSAEAIFGYSAREILGLGIGLILPDQDYERLVTLSSRLLCDPNSTQVWKPDHQIVRGRRKDGTPISLEASAAVARLEDQSGHTLVLRDISDRLRAERELRESQERLQTLLQTIPDPVWLKDTQGRFLACNRRFEALYGASEADIVGKTDDDFTDRASADFFRAHDLATMAAGRARTNEEEILFASDGHRELMQTIKTPVLDGRGEIMGVLGIARDITELKRAEHELEQHRNHLQELVDERTAELRATREQAIRLANSKSQFLANMSHEIRTPMNAVLGLAHLLERQDLPVVARDLARKIHRSGQSLLGIINDILDFSKIESGKIDIEHIPFRLTQVLDNLATIMTATAERKAIELVMVPPICSDWPLCGDPLRLGQILINLTNNAIKFTDSGMVEVRIEPVERSHDSVLMRFAVRDTGIGIEPEAQKRLFQPFTQADVSTTRRFGGSGLGLAITRRLVDLMDGRMGLESVPGQGSTFWFEIPLSRLKQESAATRLTLGMKVLVVGDNPVVLDGLMATVASLGWSANRAASWQEAMDRVLHDEELQGPDAAVLLDWHLPGQEGSSTLSGIREALPEPRRPLLFLLTAHPLEEVMASLNETSVEAVLDKPLSPSPLYDAVVRARGRRLGQTVMPPHPRAQDRQRLDGLRLLVVDDNDINREVAQQIFADEGARVSLAGDGQEALDWLTSHPDQVDIVLMDVQMPVMDGHEATRRIRQNERHSRLPVVALTAGAMQSQELSAKEAGMDAFLSKPLDVEEAVSLIRDLVHGRKERPASEDSAALAPVLTRDEESAMTASSVPSPAPPYDASDRNLPGLTIERGLAIWKDAEVYRRYLRRIAPQLQEAARQIASATPETARPLAHKLKGTAGNLGLMEVAERAGDLERVIAAEEPSERVRTSTMRLEAAIETALASIARYAPEPAPPPPTEPSSATAPQARDPDTIAPLLCGALRAFQDFDPIAAEPFISELSESMPGERMAAMRAALESLDSTAGERAVRELASGLGIPLEEQT
ncbi:response regulator [Imhoffiella purpurea]|uniref:histidine kinase n=1 Tax=Imhoffiella purpurea TaxID=1249627 RepID=W9VED7_9GAMM|nr:response regulator [Imhoffiella purpurea]EXJ14402.1 Putative sensor/response regulator hybrid [Imhoffiella purpurea]